MNGEASTPMEDAISTDVLKMPDVPNESDAVALQRRDAEIEALRIRIATQTVELAQLTLIAERRTVRGAINSAVELLMKSHPRAPSRAELRHWLSRNLPPRAKDWIKAVLTRLQ